MAILVCGGAGYIGSHTVAELLEAGEEVVVVDNLQKGHREAVLGGKFYQVDLRDDAGLARVFEENQIDAVIHFAADSLVGESVTEPLKYYNNNVYATMKLLETMRKYNVLKIVFSSTAATYGEPEQVPIPEVHPNKPTNPYGETKLAIEKMLKWSDNAYGMKYVALRYFNAAGAHKSGKIGEDHAPETHLIPNVLFAALGKKELTLFGDDYPTPDGTCVRDYIHVTDLADAHLRAVKKLREGGDSSIYNLGSGSGFSNKEIVDIAKEVTGVNFKVNMGPRRAGDPAKLIASSDRIKKELGWAPKYENLRDIIGSAWNWHKNHPDGYGDK